MKIIQGFFSVRWMRRVVALFLVFGMSFLMATACNNNCDEDDIDFGEVDTIGECADLAADQACDDFVFDEITGDCQGIDCFCGID